MSHALPHQKITPSHLQREAYLYVRQSSIRQVMENTESTARQYQLREQALALGWQIEQVRVIDCDLGRSGASEVGRDGFQQLVAAVSMNQAGVVMGLEVSRLARNNADWHRLLQLCAFTDTLILDQDGLYDPSAFNDRLVLGLKGTMSEAELHVLRSRLQEGILNKARRGELKIPLPAGFVYDELERVVKTPDTQVRAAFERFFAAFERLGAAFAVVREFRRENIQMPHYSRIGPKSSRIIWGPLTHSQALRILHNPRYAGAFAYGRSRARCGPDGNAHYKRVPRDQWTTLITDAHDGYISWESYERNQKTLNANNQAYGKDRRVPPREGPALLQGIIICGHCGKRMTVRYHQRRGQLLPDYICQRDSIEHGKKHTCCAITGASIDQAIGDLVCEMLDQQAIDLALAIRHELADRLDQADRCRAAQVERCRYEADLARQRYQQVDPSKRYVAEVLEAEWNEKLRALDEAQQTYDQQSQRDQQQLSTSELASLSTLSDDFREVWQSTELPDQARKRMIRLLIEDITFLRGKVITAHIRFKGGSSKTLTFPLPLPIGERRKTPAETVATIDCLLDQYPAYRIIEILNERGIQTGGGARFTARQLALVCRTYELSPRRRRLRAAGKLTTAELAAKFRVGTDKIRRCGHLGLLTAHEYSQGRYLYDEPSDDILDRVPQLKTHAHLKLPTSTHEV